MGGYGSGRPSHKRKTEDCLALDVNRMHRDGALAAGRRGDRVWSRNGKEVARIGYHVKDQSLVLKYRTRRYEADWQSVTEAVLIDRAPCRYGGQRPYFRCPGVVRGRHCNRRVVKLYMGGTYFLCRHCYNLAYTSQSEPAYGGQAQNGKDEGFARHVPEHCASQSKQTQRKLDTGRVKRHYVSHKAKHHFFGGTIHSHLKIKAGIIQR